MLTAIEIRAGSLVVVTARPGAQGPEIVHAGTADLPDLGVGKLRAALVQCGLSEPSRRQRVVLLIPRGQALLRDIELPESTPAELVSMVRFQVEREMPLPLDQL